MMPLVNDDIPLSVEMVQPITEVQDIQKQVKLHAQTALCIAFMEKCPPGYTQETWAVFLIDKSPAELRDRFARCVKREEVRFGGFAPDIQGLLECPTSFIPSLPAQVPAELAPKMRELDRQWTRDLFDRKCKDVLAPFSRSIGRDSRIFRQASAQVYLVYSSMAQSVLGGRLPFTAKLHMDKQGNFDVRMTERF